MAKKLKGRLNRMNSTGVGRIKAILSTIEDLLIKNEDIDLPTIKNLLRALVETEREDLKQKGY